MVVFDPIGFVETPFTSSAAAPTQGEERSERGTIILDESYEPGLVGLEPDDRLEVIWFADRADRSRLSFDRDEPRGVFTTRSQDRPNPICITEIRLIARNGTDLTVEGVDMVDGTPVFDLKPTLRR